MSTFTTSRGTRCQHVPPKYMTRPYRMHPGRREHIHGRIQPLYSDNTGGWLGYAIMFAVACMIGFALAAGAM